MPLRFMRLVRKYSVGAGATDSLTGAAPAGDDSLVSTSPAPGADGSAATSRSSAVSGSLLGSATGSSSAPAVGSTESSTESSPSLTLNVASSASGDFVA